MGLLEDVKDALFLDTAEGLDLTVVGGNEGVERPQYNTADSLYRLLVPILGLSAKTTKTQTKKLIDAFFGEGSGVEMFQVDPNVLYVRIPRSVFPAQDLASATYLQRQVTPIATTLSVDATPGDTSLVVASTASIVSGSVEVGEGDTKDVLPLDRTTPTTGLTILNLALGNKVRYTQLAGAPVRQIKAEPSGASYAGDFFGVARVAGTLASPVTAGDTAATLTSGHLLPGKGFFYFEEDVPARRERLFCSLSGDTLTVLQFPGHFPAVAPQFLYNHAALTRVVWFDLEDFSEPSSLANGGDPVILTADSRINDLLAALDLVTASGVEVRIEEY